MKRSNLLQFVHTIAWVVFIGTVLSLGVMDIRGKELIIKPLGAVVGWITIALVVVLLFCIAYLRGKKSE